MLVALLALGAGACGAGKGRASQPLGSEKPEREPLPQVHLTGVQVQLFRGPELRAVSHARDVTYQQGSEDVVALDVTVKVPPAALSDGGTPAAAGTQMQAPRVEGNLVTREAEALGGVVLQSPMGFTGRTERAHLSAARQEAVSEAPVRVDGPGYHLTAEQAVMHLNTDALDFEGHVASELHTNPGVVP